MRLTGGTKVYALVGQPVVHSRSPRLMNGAFQRMGRDAVYVALPVDPDQPATVLQGLQALGVAGANVTYPLKSAILSQLDTVSETAREIGAVNVLAREVDGRFRGENTDAPGVALALRTFASWDAAGRAVVVVGAGAAARAVAYGVFAAGAASVVFLVRGPGRTAGLERLAVGTQTLGSADAAASLRAADLVVQATPVGLDDSDVRVLVTPTEAPEAMAFELNYGARPTAFARAWRDAGRPTLDGRDLLAAQGQLTLEIWCGETPVLTDLRRMLDDQGAS